MFETYYVSQLHGLGDNADDDIRDDDDNADGGDDDDADGGDDDDDDGDDDGDDDDDDCMLGCSSRIWHRPRLGPQSIAII